MPVTLPDPQLPGDPRDALQSIQRNFEALSLLSPLPLPVGTVLPYAASSSPDGFRACDGTSLLKADYPALFEVIGYTYGGSGANFSLPNLKGRLPVGVDATQSEFDTLGETGGAKTVTLTEAQMPYHRHSFTPAGSISGTVGNHQHSVNLSGTVTYAQAANTATGGSGNRSSLLGTGNSQSVPIIGNTGFTQPTFSGSFTGTPGDTGYSGGSGGVTQAHPNLQPYITLTFIIKT